MGVLTWADAATDVVGQLGNRNTIDAVQVHQWLIRSLMHLSNPKVFKHPELYRTDQVTLAATNWYAIPASIANRTAYFVEGVRNSTQGYSLVSKDRLWFRERVQTTPGRPSHYLHYGEAGVDRLKVYPWPSAECIGDVLDVELYLRPAISDAATEPGDVSPLGAEWDEVWVTGAVWRGWRWLQQPAMADQVRADYAGLINDMQERLGFESEADPQEIEFQVAYSAQRFSS